MSLLLCLALLSLSTCAQAQTLIDPSRRINWSGAGVPGGIPNRTTICATLNPGATAAQINSAIAVCPSGQVVKLAAGTYTLSAGIEFKAKSNVTLRGAGPDATFIVFTGNTRACSGLKAGICLVNAYPNDGQNFARSANWTAGFAQGATSITLDNTPDLKVGSQIILDQVRDNADTGDVFQSTKRPATGPAPRTCIGCNSPGRSTQVGFPTDNAQQHIATVTAINGNTVTISPGLFMPNWRLSQKPGAWWSPALPLVGSGVEDISLDYTSAAAQYGIVMFNVQQSWVKNVRSIKAASHHVIFYQSSRNTIRDSYFFDSQTHKEQSYGIGNYEGASNLVENNIFVLIATPTINETDGGSVFAYNYSANDLFFDGTWAQGSAYTHSPGTNYVLWEGNDGFGLTMDNYHGTAHFITAFRNRWNGKEPLNLQQTVPVHIYSWNRYVNIIGNVLGEPGYHTNYQKRAGIDTSDVNRCFVSIYGLGWGGNCSDPTPGVHPDNDTAAVSTVSTLFRWGNYDVVTGAPKWDKAEVPSGLAKYANAVPSDQTLPASLYLSGRPSWWGTMPFPAIGPDVTGGDLVNLGGHAYRIPARKCFENVMGGKFGDTSPRTFNATKCYGTSTGPAGPTGLQVR
jgi:hypothetical protein